MLTGTGFSHKKVLSLGLKGAMLWTVGGQFSRVSEATVGHGAVWEEGVLEGKGEGFLGEGAGQDIFFLYLFMFFRVRGGGDWGGRCGRASA